LGYSVLFWICYSPSNFGVSVHNVMTLSNNIAYFSGFSLAHTAEPRLKEEDLRNIGNIEYGHLCDFVCFNKANMMNIGDDSNSLY